MDGLKQFAPESALGIVSLLWGALVFLPSMLMIFLGASSFAQGVLVSSILMTMATLISSVRKPAAVQHHDFIVLIVMMSLMLFVLVHYALINITVQSHERASFTRFIVGYLGFYLVLLSAFLVAKAVSNLPNKILKDASAVVLFCLLVNVLVATSRIDFFNTGNIKPSFMFMEPSHIALTASSLLMFWALVSSPFRNVLIAMLVMLWGIYIQNLTTLILFLMIVIVSVRVSLWLFVPAAVAMLSVLIAYYGVGGLTYFVERVSFTPDSPNLSVVVYMQGVDNAFRTLESTHWLGAGFQQLGIATQDGPYTERVLDMSGINSNQYDGSLTAAKLVSEFGIFGIAALITHFVMAIKSFFDLRKFALLSKNAKENYSFSVVLANTVVVCSLLELYVRGVGYFSPMMAMLVISVIVLYIKFSSKQIVADSPDFFEQTKLAH